MSSPPYALKRALRKVTQQRLRALSRQDVESQSQRIWQHLKESGVLDGKRGIGCYLSMQDGEVGTEGIVREVLWNQTPLYVPIIPVAPSAPRHTPPPPQHDMRMLRLYSQRDLESLARDKWGIPDAGDRRADLDEATRREDCMSEHAPPLDVILVPGVCFDAKFQRLGHGKGYYDRYIERYRAFASQRGEKPPLLVALALSEQVLPFASEAANEPQTDQERLQARARALTEVPTTEDDVLMDWIVTPQGVRRRGADSVDR
ncbi:hypothetical protein NliqN6_3418 [Naganishia liquefaciens]|uniref:5-formyltetrahydrofolate cyclo-ligase n=1 Tax=Naganishia liquefaciens TaxID=104408 RepID=A0A8H3TT51_9TREE|nr:hypothetical protein NliqN6_3418 [Naganishia liquefaciens]